jgi:hypothetical protein
VTKCVQKSKKGNVRLKKRPKKSKDKIQKRKCRVKKRPKKE